MLELFCIGLFWCLNIGRWLLIYNGLICSFKIFDGIELFVALLFNLYSENSVFLFSDGFSMLCLKD